MLHKSTKFLIWILLGKFGATFLPPDFVCHKSTFGGADFFGFLAPREGEEALLDLAKATSVLVKESKRRIHYRRQPTRSRRHQTRGHKVPPGKNTGGGARATARVCVGSATALFRLLDRSFSSLKSRTRKTSWRPLDPLTSQRADPSRLDLFSRAFSRSVFSK